MMDLSAINTSTYFMNKIVNHYSKVNSGFIHVMGKE